MTPKTCTLVVSHHQETTCTRSHTAPSQLGETTNVLSLLLIQWSRIQKLCHLSFNEVPSSSCYVALWYVHLCITVCSKQFLGQASFSFQWLSFLQHLESRGRGFPSADKFVQTKMKVILLSTVNSQQRFNSIPSL